MTEHALVAPEHLGDRDRQLARDHVRRVSLEHARVGLDDLAERPERHALAVGKAAPLQPDHLGGVGGGDRVELAHQAGLADAGRPDQRHELRRTVGTGAQQGVREQIELAPAPGECRRRPAPLRRAPRAKDRVVARVVDGVLGRPPRAVARDDGAARRAVAHSPGAAGDIAADALLARPRAGDHERLARDHGDPHAEPLAQGERSADGSLRVVLVGAGRAERRQHGAAGGALERPAEAVELLADDREAALEHRLGVLRVDSLTAGRLVQVAGEHAHELALAAPQGGRGGRRGRGERRLAGEDRALERAQRRARLQPEFRCEDADRIAIDAERIRLAPGAVQGEHELSSQPLAQRLVAGELFELGHELGMAAEHELRVDAALEREESQLLDARDVGAEGVEVA